MFLVLVACGATEPPQGPAAPEAPAAPPSAVPMPAPGDAVAGKAELLARCLAEHATTGRVTLDVTTTDGRIATATVSDASSADPAFAACLATHAVGMPHEGAAKISLTAM